MLHRNPPPPTPHSTRRISPTALWPPSRRRKRATGIALHLSVSFEPVELEGRRPISFTWMDSKHQVRTEQILKPMNARAGCFKQIKVESTLNCSPFIQIALSFKKTSQIPNISRSQSQVMPSTVKRQSLKSSAASVWVMKQTTPVKALRMSRLLDGYPFIVIGFVVIKHGTKGHIQFIPN